MAGGVSEGEGGVGGGAGLEVHKIRIPPLYSRSWKSIEEGLEEILPRHRLSMQY